MSRKNVKIIKCDECCKEQTYDDQLYVGGSPLTGWIHVKRLGGTTSLISLREKREFDFCSAKCLVKKFDHAMKD